MIWLWILQLSISAGIVIRFFEKGSKLNWALLVLSIFPILLFGVGNILKSGSLVQISWIFALVQILGFSLFSFYLSMKEDRENRK